MIFHVCVLVCPYPSREFYYIQMEKYARQALSEGVKSSEDLVVTCDNELYRVLNLHYNRNNHIEVSDENYIVRHCLVVSPLRANRIKAISC